MLRVSRPAAMDGPGEAHSRVHRDGRHLSRRRVRLRVDPYQKRVQGQDEHQSLDIDSAPHRRIDVMMPQLAPPRIIARNVLKRIQRSRSSDSLDR